MTCPDNAFTPHMERDDVFTTYAIVGVITVALLVAVFVPLAPGQDVEQAALTMELRK